MLPLRLKPQWAATASDRAVAVRDPRQLGGLDHAVDAAEQELPDAAALVGGVDSNT